jgi:hypothetical protein
MDGVSQSSLDPAIIEFRELQIDFTEFVPLLLAQGINEGREIERRIVTHILVRRVVSRLNVEIDNPLVNILHILEGSDEGTNVLESCASHNFRGWVFQEPIVDICQLLALFI